MNIKDTIHGQIVKHFIEELNQALKQQLKNQSVNALRKGRDTLVKKVDRYPNALLKSIQYKMYYKENTQKQPYSILV